MSSACESFAHNLGANGTKMVAGGSMNMLQSLIQGEGRYQFRVDELGDAAENSRRAARHGFRGIRRRQLDGDLLDQTAGQRSEHDGAILGVGQL